MTIFSPPFSPYTPLLPGPNSPDSTSAWYLYPPHPSCDQNIDPNASPEFIRGASPPVACWATHVETEVVTEKTIKVNKTKKAKKARKAKKAKRESKMPISPVNPPQTPATNTSKNPTAPSRCTKRSACPSPTPSQTHPVRDHLHRCPKEITPASTIETYSAPPAKIPSLLDLTFPTPAQLPVHISVMHSRASTAAIAQAQGYGANKSCSVCEAIFTSHTQLKKHAARHFSGLLCSCGFGTANGVRMAHHHANNSPCQPTDDQITTLRHSILLARSSLNILEEQLNILMSKTSKR